MARTCFGTRPEIPHWPLENWEQPHCHPCGLYIFISEKEWYTNPSLGTIRTRQHTRSVGLYRTGIVWLCCWSGDWEFCELQFATKYQYRGSLPWVDVGLWCSLLEGALPPCGNSVHFSCHVSRSSYFWPWDAALFKHKSLSAFGDGFAVQCCLAAVDGTKSSQKCRLFHHGERHHWVGVRAVPLSQARRCYDERHRPSAAKGYQSFYGKA